MPRRLFLIAVLTVSLGTASEFPPAVPADVHDALVAKKLKKIDEIIAAAPYKPTIESLRKIGIPEWYADTKFGYKDLILMFKGEKFDPTA